MVGNINVMGKKEFSEIVDAVIKEAYINGFSLDFSKYMNLYAVKGRLGLYGSIVDDRYYLNELGLKYAMDGCSEGIERRLQLESYQAAIEMKVITEEANRIANAANEKAKLANLMAAVLGGVSIVLSALSVLL